MRKRRGSALFRRYVFHRVSRRRILVHAMSRHRVFFEQRERESDVHEISGVLLRER